MKTYPANWNTAQAAYFSGLLCSEIIISGRLTNLGVEAIVRDCSYVPSGGGVREIRFTELIERVAPRITESQWAEIVGCCQRIFA